MEQESEEHTGGPVLGSSSSSSPSTDRAASGPTPWETATTNELLSAPTSGRLQVTTTATTGALAWAPQGFKQHTYRPVQFRPPPSAIYEQHPAIGRSIASETCTATIAPPFSSPAADVAPSEGGRLNEDNTSLSTDRAFLGRPSYSELRETLPARTENQGHDSRTASDLRSCDAPDLVPDTVLRRQDGPRLLPGMTAGLSAAEPPPGKAQRPQLPPPTAPKPNKGLRLFMAQQHRSESQTSSPDDSLPRAVGSNANSDDEDSGSAASEAGSVTSAKSLKLPPIVPPKPRLRQTLNPALHREKESKDRSEEGCVIAHSDTCNDESHILAAAPVKEAGSQAPPIPQTRSSVSHTEPNVQGNVKRKSLYEIVSTEGRRGSLK